MKTQYILILIILLTLISQIAFADPGDMLWTEFYGYGSIEVANLLEFHRIDYLGVAYTDEGVTLRKNGINLA